MAWSAPKGDKFPGAGNHDGRDAVRRAFVSDVERSLVAVEIYADSEAFPGVVTEEEHKEQEREEQDGGTGENDDGATAEGKHDGEGEQRDGEKRESRASEKQA